MNNKTNGNSSTLKKALLIVHQKRSDPGEIGQKLKTRGSRTHSGCWHNAFYCLCCSIAGHSDACFLTPTISMQTA